MPVYRHRQSSRIIPVVTLALAVTVVATALTKQRPSVFAPVVIVGLIGIALTSGFWSLTVEVSERELVWFFGPGIWRKRIDRDEIVSVAAVRNPWWYGIGIHRTPRGWLYNVAGGDAVEITLTTDRMLRIGTDEPDALIGALRRR